MSELNHLPHETDPWLPKLASKITCCRYFVSQAFLWNCFPYVMPNAKNCLLAKVINQINQQQKEKIYFLMKLTSNLQINLFLIRPAFFTPCPRSLSGMLCNISQEERRESVFPWCTLWEGFFLRRKLTNYPCQITESYWSAKSHPRPAFVSTCIYICIYPFFYIGMFYIFSRLNFAPCGG